MAADESAAIHSFRVTLSVIDASSDPQPRTVVPAALVVDWCPLLASRDAFKNMYNMYSPGTGRARGVPCQKELAVGQKS